MARWYDVEKTKPKKDGTYLVKLLDKDYGYENIGTVEYYNGEWDNKGYCWYKQRITHWAHT